MKETEKELLKIFDGADRGFISQYANVTTIEKIY
jgi:hypothetical protein